MKPENDLDLLEVSAVLVVLQITWLAKFTGFLLWISRQLFYCFVIYEVLIFAE